MENLNDLVNRFLCWPLPPSVCSDLCVTTRDGEHAHLRRGTNLLTAIEARQMVDDIFVPEFSRLHARIKELEDALRAMRHAVCGETGFAEAVRRDSGHAYPWPALDAAEELVARALKDKTDG